jgi:hypothetical protein
MVGRGRRWGRYCNAKRGIDDTQHAADIFQHIVVPNSHDAIAVVPQKFSALLIAYCLNANAVVPTIQLDDNSICMACKIDKVTPNGRLASKMRGADRQLSQLPP